MLPMLSSSLLFLILHQPMLASHPPMHESDSLIKRNVRFKGQIGLAEKGEKAKPILLSKTDFVGMMMGLGKRVIADRGNNWSKWLVCPVTELSVHY